MTPKDILDIIDRTIIISFNNGKCISETASELKIRSQKFLNVLLKEKSIDEIDQILTLTWDKVDTIRVKYGSFYIRSCYKRINDLEWIIKNRYKFDRYDDKKVFNLIKFKEKLLTEDIIV